MKHLKKCVHVAGFFLFIFQLSSCHQKKIDQNSSLLPQIEKTNNPSKCLTKKLTILGTNDIHGNIEGKVFSLNGPNGEKRKVGGLSLLSAYVNSIRKNSDECNGVLLLDGGDQFQGTLLSNYNEGQLIAQSMKEIGYDAMVPGNHDYDFGPLGWENDSVAHAKEKNLNSLERYSIQKLYSLKSNKQHSETDPMDPKAALIAFKNTSEIPLLSANTYELSSLKNSEGQPLKVEQTGCKPMDVNEKIDWLNSKRPSFLEPYLIKTISGIKVGIIGLDIAITPTVTTKANVLDLCFRDPVEEFLGLSLKLKKEEKVDVVVVVAHFGDASKESQNLVREAQKPSDDKVVDDLSISQFLDRVLTHPSCLEGNCIDALVGGHTHSINQIKISGIPAIQSGSNAQRFGQIKLFIDSDTGKVDRSKTEVYAGKYLVEDTCDSGTESFCRAENGKVFVEGNEIQLNQKIIDFIKIEKKKVSLLADRILGNAQSDINVNRSDENALGNHLADTLLEIGKPYSGEVAFLNSGGIRNALKKGNINYSSFYDVLPFNNRAVVIPNFKVSDLVTLVKKAIQSCGRFGGMNFSGITVQYKKDCSDKSESQEDLNAILLRMESNQGEIFYDGQLPEEKRIANDRNLNAVTLDFLAEGGSAYADAFHADQKQILIPGPFRENFVNLFLLKPFDWNGKTDGRFKNIK